MLTTELEVARNEHVKDEKGEIKKCNNENVMKNW